MVPEGHQWGQEVEEEAGVKGVHPFPDRVWYSIRAWCRRGGGLGQGGSDFLHGEGFG